MDTQTDNNAGGSPKPSGIMPAAPLRRWSRTSLKLLVVAALTGLLVYKLKYSPVPVASHRIAPGPVVAEVMGTGTLEARVKTTISPRIQERLAEVLVDQGDLVKAGQLLARLDDGELKQQVEVAEAALASARASAERVRVTELPRNWAVGQRAEVFIETGRKPEALAVPQRFVRWREGRPGVFINDHGKAKWRAVSLGLRGRETVEITQGLSAGEQFVIPAESKKELRDGQRVNAREARPTKAAVAP